VTLDPWIVVAVLTAASLLIVPRLLAGPRAPPALVEQKLAAGATIVDVRSPVEFSSGAHPRAVNIPLHELGSRLAEIPRGRPVVLYCASGMRSGQAVRVLTRAGFADVVNAGGLRNLPQ
jgi:phage shock protein E